MSTKTYTAGVKGLQSDLANLWDIQRFEYTRNETRASIRGSITDVTMIDMCVFVGGSTKLGMTPGGGGPDGVFVGSIIAKSMADITENYVPCASKLKTRPRKSTEIEKHAMSFDCLTTAEHPLEGGEQSSRDP